VIAPGDTTLAPAQLPAGSSRSAFSDLSSLVGRTLVTGVGSGELIQSSMLSSAGTTPPLRPVSVAVDPSSVVGLAPGDPVDVLAVGSGGGSGAVTVVARGASLIAIDSSQAATIGSTSATLVTLGVGNLSEVEALVGASHSGVIALVRSEPSDGVGAGPGSD
jgi:hypothetical protein